MILDKLFQFTGIGPSAPSNNDGLNDAITTAVTGQASSGTVDIGIGLQTTTNPLGLAIPGAPGFGARDLGIGDDPAMKVLVEVVSVPTGGTNIFIVLAAAPDNGSGAPGTFVPYATGPTIAAANVVQGAHLFDVDIPRPPSGQALPRYWQLQVTSTGTFANLLIRGNVVLDRFDQIVSTTGALSGYVPGITIAN